MAVATERIGKPTALVVNLNGIPPELKGRNQWALWSWQCRNDNWTKVPYQPNGNHAAADNAKTWMSFDTAAEAHQEGGNRWDGIFWCFSAGDPFWGLDFDGCCIPGERRFKAWSAEFLAKCAGSPRDAIVLIKHFGTYCEFSPSDTGVKLVGIGNLPGKRHRLGNKASGIELYDKARFWAMTGHRVPGTPAAVNDSSEALHELYVAMFGENKPVNNMQVITTSTGYVPTVEEIITKASNADNGEKFIRLFRDGDTSGYPSSSEADQALAGVLAFWCGPHPDLAEQCMRRSKLAREKWNSHRTYLQNTIAKALEDRTEFYGWESPSRGSASGGTTNFHRTDLGNAQRLVSLHQPNLRYCHPWKKFLVWDGKRWAFDDTGQAERFAKQTVRTIWEAVSREDGSEVRKALAKWAAASESAKQLGAMLNLARSEEGIPVLPAVLDKKPWLLNCKNGTLDLRTGELRAPRREDYITKLVPVEYLPDATCPRWLRFLDTIFAGRQTLVEFVRRLLGYSLTGVVRDHVLPIFYGTGGNGKTTLLETIMGVLGEDYAMKGPHDLLMSKRGGHPTERADLFGKRLVVCIETEDNRRLAEAMVKECTGGDTIRARRMREDFWQFTATHKIILATNHKPVVQGTDHAIWRRLRIVPFQVTIPDNEQDKGLREKLRGELPGILAWCVQGCLDWQRTGLGAPEEVTTATAAYRKEQDIVGEFIAEHCLEGPTQKARAKDLWAAYKAFCENAGEEWPTQRRFGITLTERGFRRYHNNGVWYRGVGIRTEGTE